ncbi:hypothetical protein NLJ89_g9255 [Agrocybe chaxingu]|uniref:Uncharacterized protein n=1 Tax=Agrocybe chaxingu TaxID=84603 RepID=A0A9W8K0B4_9AGAR|nr:hypothetical protein NLJ89_g9255 [Agrocybe chaxingu]
MMTYPPLEKLAEFLGLSMQPKWMPCERGDTRRYQDYLAVSPPPQRYVHVGRDIVYAEYHKCIQRSTHAGTL